MHTTERPDNVTAFPAMPRQSEQQQQPDFSPAGFGHRLVAGLDALNIPENQRAPKVAEAAGVTIRTARRYLAGTSQPRGAVRQAALAVALDLAPAWLVFGEHGLKTKAELEQFAQFVQAYRNNPPWRQRLIERALTRMANKSPRVERLQNLREAGQLSPDDFLRLAGR